MNLLYKWLSQYDVEYNVHTQVVHIRKDIPVTEFMLLRKILEPYMYKVKDIVVGRWI